MKTTKRIAAAALTAGLLVTMVGGAEAATLERGNQSNFRSTIIEKYGEDFKFQTATDEQKTEIMDLLKEKMDLRKERYQGKLDGIKQRIGGKGEGNGLRSELTEKYGEDFKLSEATEDQLEEIKELMTEKVGEEKAELFLERLETRKEYREKMVEAFGEEYKVKDFTDEQLDEYKNILIEVHGEEKGAEIYDAKVKHIEFREAVVEKYGEDFKVKEATDEQKEEIKELAEKYGIEKLGKRNPRKMFNNVNGGVKRGMRNQNAKVQ
ncbi:MAG: hypothetical protein N4A47_04680 [Clostridia bacterium]|jgi:hypothetical protein|nr:hypothetical protein [Clostridia bacterium]